MKKYRIVKFLGVILVFCLSLMAIYYLFKPNFDLDKDKDSVLFSKEYTKVTENNVFVYKTEEQIINILEKGTGIVYLGFPECPWCQEYVGLLNEVAKEKGITKIYYYNIKEARIGNTNGYRKIVDILDDYLYLDDAGKDRVMVPDLTMVVNGEIKFHDNETCNISNGNISDYWTDAKKKEFKTKIAKAIDDNLVGSCTSCN